MFRFPYAFGDGRVEHVRGHDPGDAHVPEQQHLHVIQDRRRDWQPRLVDPITRRVVRVRLRECLYNAPTTFHRVDVHVQLTADLGGLGLLAR